MKKTNDEEGPGSDSRVQVTTAFGPTSQWPVVNLEDVIMPSYAEPPQTLESRTRSTAPIPDDFLPPSYDEATGKV